MTSENESLEDSNDEQLEDMLREIGREDWVRWSVETPSRDHLSSDRLIAIADSVDTATSKERHHLESCDDCDQLMKRFRQGLTQPDSSPKLRENSTAEVPTSQQGEQTSSETRVAATLVSSRSGVRRVQGIALQAIVLMIATGGTAFWVWNSQVEAADERRELLTFSPRLAKAFDAVEDDADPVALLGELHRELRTAYPRFAKNRPLWIRLVAQVDSLMCIDSTQVEQFEEAIRLGQAAVDSLRRAKAPAAERALAHYALGKALFEAGRRSATDRKSLLLDAVEHISQADSLIAKSPKNQFRVFGADATRSVVRARILTTLAVAVHKGVDHKLALFIYDHAGELLPFLSEQDNAATLRLRARWHADRGLSLAAGGSFDDLLDAGFGYSEGLAIVADSKNHYLTAVLHSNRADVLTQLGLFEDEINDRTAAIKALRRFSNRRRTANWFDNLVLNMSRRSFALVQLNRLEEAIHDTRLIEVLAPIEAKHQQLGISELIEIVLIAGADETRSIDSREALMKIAAKRLEHVLDTRSMDIGQLDFTLRAFTDLRHVRDDPRMQELLQQLHDLAHSSDAD